MQVSAETLAAALLGVPWGGARPSLLPRNPRSAGTLRAALLEALEPFTDGQVAHCALSGGVDSATLLALLADHGPCAWTLADEGLDDPEVIRARQMAESLDVTHEVVSVSSEELWSAFSEAVHACGILIYNGRAVAKYLFYRELAARGVTSIISGLGADEVLFGDPLRLLRGDPFVRDRALLRSFLLPSLQEIDVPTPPRLLRLEDARAYALSETLPNDGLPPEQSAGEAAGLSVSLPFLSTPVISWGLSTPVDRLVVGSTGKMVLRSLASGLVPDSIRLAPKQPRLQPVGRWGGVLNDTLSTERLQTLGLVDAARVHSALKRYHKDGGGRDAAALERVLLRLASLSVLLLDA